MAGETTAQQIIHTLEQGRVALFVRVGAFVVLIVALTLLYLFVQFRGFATPTAMDQAQIARNIAEGKGFTTQVIRPFAIRQLKEADKEIPKDLFPDFYQAPLNPFVNAWPLSMVKASWKMTRADFIYSPERAIALTSILFFLLSVVVWYFIGSQLFDNRLSFIACIIVVLTDMMWQFSLSGLPQMLMLFLFSGIVWLTIFAIRHRDSLIVLLATLFGIGLMFGLLTLAHGLAFWIFLGWLIFALIYFPPRGVAALVAVAGLLIVVLPWMARNNAVCGNPFGLSIYDMVSWDPAEAGYLRSLQAAPDVSQMYPFARIRTGVLDQVKSIFSFLGMNLAAGAFFLALLHPFRSPVASVFRWCVLLMWVFAVIGMALFGLGSGVISSNQLHVLFIPIFVLYGLSFLMVLWSRWNIHLAVLRTMFIALIVILCSIPLLTTLLAGRQSIVQWPPYVPPFIAILGEWFGPDEIIASDVPWAVAWYAQRESLLLPETLDDFNYLSDYRVLGYPVNGLYLTPVTRNAPLFTGIYKGFYKGWISLITWPPTVEGFALPAFTPLPVDGECIIFADRDRWTKRDDTP